MKKNILALTILILSISPIYSNDIFDNVDSTHHRDVSVLRVSYNIANEYIEKNDLLSECVIHAYDLVEKRETDFQLWDSTVVIEELYVLYEKTLFEYGFNKEDVSMILYIAGQLIDKYNSGAVMAIITVLKI